MQKYFNINLEFDKTIIDNTIKETLAKNGKGYICVMESNNFDCSKYKLSLFKYCKQFPYKYL